MICPECHKDGATKNGMAWRARQRVQKYICNHCGYQFTPTPKERAK